MADIVLNRATYIEFPNNPEVNTHLVQIESGSLLLEEILCEKNITFGETNATRFEATVYNLEDVSGLKIKVYQTDIEGHNRRNIFEGYVDSCKKDKDGYFRKLVAYDALYSIGNANVAGWWLQFWNNRRAPSATMQEIRHSLCDWVGIRYDANAVLHNEYLRVQKSTTISSVSFNTILFWIGEIQCAVPHIDREGVLQFIPLTSQPNTDLTNMYEHDTSEFEGFVTAPIDTVELYGYDSNLVATTNTTGAVPSKNTYVIKDNALLFALEDEGNESFAAEFVQNYLAQIQEIRYTPCDLNMIVSDLDLQLGQYIQVGDIVSIILQNTLSGNLLVEQEIQSSGNEYLQDSDTTLTPEYLSLQKRTDEMHNDIITDDLLNYAYMNHRPYDIENVVTPIVELSISMPHTSNLVFLATVNLEVTATETREVQEVVKFGDVECTMTRTEKVPVIVESFFEWNGAQILSNMPTETYSEDGKHLLNLMFFTVGGRPTGGDVTFKVFLKVHHGRVYIGQNQVNATIISKGSSAGNLPWDGTITVEQEIKPITVANFTPTIANMLDILNEETAIPTTPPTATEEIGLIAPDFGTIQIAGIDESVDTHTTS